MVLYVIVKATNSVCNVLFATIFSEKGDVSEFGSTDVVLFWHNVCTAAGMHATALVLFYAYL